MAKLRAPAGAFRDRDNLDIGARQVEAMPRMGNGAISDYASACCSCHGGQMQKRAIGSTEIDEPSIRNDRESADDGSYFVQSLARGLGVVKAFGRDARSLTLGEVARRTGMSRAAARRYLLTLRDLGYVQVRGSEFSLRPKLLELGYAYLSSLSLWEVSQPILEELVDRIGESCSVCVLDMPDIVYIARVQVKRIIAPTVSIGSRLPAFVTAAGRAILSASPTAEVAAYLENARLVAFTKRTISSKAALQQELQRIAKSGYAVVDQEFELGLCAIAVPVRDRSGRVVAAITSSAHAHRLSPRDLVDRILPHLKAASAEITANLP